MKALLLNIFKGIALIVVLWAINTFIAFVIFTPTDEHTKIINITWLITDIALYIFLVKLKFINWQVNVFAILTVLTLVLLYMFAPVNRNIPEEAISLNDELSSGHRDAYEYAEELFYEVEKKWGSPIRQYLLEPHKIFFIRDFEVLWNEEGYVDSSLQAQIYRRLLLASGRFGEEEVIVKQKWCVNSPHGVTVIHHPKKDIYADLWAVDNFPREGIDEEYQFGKYAVRPCDVLAGEGF